MKCEDILRYGVPAGLAAIAGVGAIVGMETSHFTESVINFEVYRNATYSASLGQLTEFVRPASRIIYDALGGISAGTATYVLSDFFLGKLRRK